MSDSTDNKMWGGRFERSPDASFYEFQRSWRFDRRLLPYELALDRAWAKGLERARLLSADECSQILRALDGIVRRAKSDAAWLDNSKAEDVHHFVEIALIELLGPVGAKLHTGRSRNEMVATEFRMFVKEAARAMAGGVAALVEAIAQQAERNLSVPMAGMTHMQHAQPILLSHFLLAHAEAFLRDGERILSAAARADVCPLGSGALAGCAFPVDREALARELGFSGVTANSLDAVSDRDFALEYLFALSVLATHLSRLSEDFVLFASTEFSYVTLPDEFSTGSSLMPQKKNPDAWELIRGKSGRISSALVSLLMTMKGLPTSYQRDLQEDKEPLFNAHDEATGTVRVAAGALAATKFNEAKLRAGAANPALLATEAADYLVARGVPFREAHEIVGRIVREAELQSTSIIGLSLDTLRKHSP
ncbi:MAG: argininosuccinate lyase, partial [Candidatus Acidiferrales bacterium]